MRVIDVIDYDYGPPAPNGGAEPNYHHTLGDTMEHISKQSLQIVGDVALALITQADGAHSNGAQRAHAVMPAGADDPSSAHAHTIRTEGPRLRRHRCPAGRNRARAARKLLP